MMALISCLQRWSVNTNWMPKSLQTDHVTNPIVGIYLCKRSVELVLNK